VKLKSLLLVAALVIAATPSLASEDFIPQVSFEAEAIGVIGSLPGAEDYVPEDNKPQLPGKEEGNDVYFIAGSAEGQAIADMLSWRGRLQTRLRPRRA
jgi:hypothetical protein